MRTSLSNVSTAKLLSSSALRSKNNLRPRDIPIIPNVVPHAARKERRARAATVATATGMIATATGLNAKCFLRYAPSVKKIPRYHSNPAKTGRFFAVTAIIRSG